VSMGVLANAGGRARAETKMKRVTPHRWRRARVQPYAPRGHPLDGAPHPRAVGGVERLPWRGRLQNGTISRPPTGRPDVANGAQFPPVRIHNSRAAASCTPMPTQRRRTREKNHVRQRRDEDKGVQLTRARTPPGATRRSARPITKTPLQALYFAAAPALSHL
jgi:hypothetical protein